jgi:hypothetical protein
MFEQQLYEREAAEVNTQEGDLFHNYEIKNWELSKRLYQILALSAVLNLAALGFVGGTNLLTRRGCDSPFVGRVCEVLDMAYVGSIILGTERAYVDEAYDKVDLGDSDITFISRDGDNAPLSYPEGYFQVANPEQFNTAQNVTDPMMAGFPNSTFSPGPIPGIPYTPTPQNSLLNTKPIVPKYNPKSVKGQIPTDAFEVGGDNPTIPKGTGKGGKVKDANANNAKPDESDTADVNAKPQPTATPITTDAVAAVEVNKKPLTDFADVIAAQWAANQIDLNQKFTVALDGTITKDGKLDPKKSRFDKSKESGDAKMIEIAREALEALGQSGFLTYLQMIGVEKINVVIGQDDQQITAVITSTQKTPERAKSVSSLASASILTGKGLAKEPSDELTLLNGAKVSTDGNNFVLNFAVPKPIAQEMINRKLKEAQAKKAAQPQPNGNAVGRANENSAKK